MITWITENVAIGEYTDAVNREVLNKEGIDCVLSLRTGLGLEVEQDQECCHEANILENLEIYYYNVPVGINSHRNIETIKIELRTAAYMLEQLTEKYKRILVHCTAGIDRAPFVVAAYLSGLHEDIMDMDYWYCKIKEKRPQIIEHWEWI